MPKRLVSLLTLSLAAAALLVAVPTAAQADSPVTRCRYPYTLSVGGVTWTIQPCINYYDFTSVGRNPAVWADVDAWSGSTDVYLSAEVGQMQCINRCGPINWLPDTKTWFHVYPGNVYTNQLYSSPVVPGSNFCYYAKSTMLDSKTGEVGDLESPSICF